MRLKKSMSGTDLLTWALLTAVGLVVVWFVDWRLVPAMLCFFAADNISESAR